MNDREPGDQGEEVDEPELCDACGIVIGNGNGIENYAFVRDSSAIHPRDPRLDGKHMVVACSREHLSQLIEDYKRRPFNDAELWAGKIARAMFWHSGEVSEEQLAEETGLTPEQIERGVTWQNNEIQRRRRQSGEPDGGPEERG
ncbi:hypothetical protein QC281_35165 [Streptomyces sp. DH17]|nr:hypothetical protein [Streptomyces sp. DH17]